MPVGRANLHFSSVAEMLDRIQVFMWQSSGDATSNAQRQSSDYVTTHGGGDRIPVYIGGAERFLRQPNHIIVDRLQAWASAASAQFDNLIADVGIAAMAYGATFFFEMAKHIEAGYPIKVELVLGAAGTLPDDLEIVNHAWLRVDGRVIDPRPELQPRREVKVIELQGIDISPVDLYKVVNNAPVAAFISEGVAYIFHPIPGSSIVLTESTSPKEAVGRYGTAIFDTTSPSALGTKMDYLPHHKYVCTEDECDSFFETTRYRGNTYECHCTKCNEKRSFRYMGRVK